MRVQFTGRLCSCLLFFSLLAMACRGSEVLDGIAAVVGDEAILISDLEEAVAFFAMQSGMSQDQYDIDELKREMLESLLNEKILLHYAEEESLEVSRSEVDRALDLTIERIRSRFPSEEAFNEELSRENLTIEGLKQKYKQNVRDQLIQEKFLEREIYPEIEVTFREVQDSYKDHPENFALPARYRTRRIVVMPEADRSYQVSVEERLGTIREKALADPLRFPELAKAHSEDDASKNRGGNLGYMKKSALLGDIRDIVENLEIGEISEVFQSKMGCHIILLEGKDDDGYRLRHIMMQVNPRQASIEEAGRRAKDIWERLDRGEADFTELAQISRPDGEGEVDEWFIPDELPTECREEVLSLEVGSLTSPIEMQGGFCIIKLLEVQEDRVMPLAEAEPHITEALKREKMGAVLEEKLKELRKDVYVKVYVEL